MDALRVAADKALQLLQGANTPQKVRLRLVNKLAL